MTASLLSRFFLEGCALDPLLDDHDLLACVLEARRRGLAQLCATDLTRQDLNEVKNAGRREELLGLLELLASITVGVPAILVNEGETCASHLPGQRLSRRPRVDRAP